MEKQIAYQKLVDELRARHRKEGFAGSSQAVPGEGSLSAKVMFVGEAPGAKEDELGRPFVGQAGKFLDQLIESLGWQRRDVYITNILKFRPPGNRDPLAEEIEAFRPCLLREIEIIQPELIVVLGRHALQSLLPGEKISELRGTALKKGRLVYFVTYHPAAALYNPSLKEAIKADFKKIPIFLEKIEKNELPSSDEKREISQKTLF